MQGQPQKVTSVKLLQFITQFSPIFPHFGNQWFGGLTCASSILMKKIGHCFNLQDVKIRITSIPSFGRQQLLIEVLWSLEYFDLYRFLFYIQQSSLIFLPQKSKVECNSNLEKKLKLPQEGYPKFPYPYNYNHFNRPQYWNIPFRVVSSILMPQGNNFKGLIHIAFPKKKEKLDIKRFWGHQGHPSNTSLTITLQQPSDYFDPVKTLIFQSLKKGKLEEKESLRTTPKYRVFCLLVIYVLLFYYAAQTSEEFA